MFSVLVIVQDGCIMGKRRVCLQIRPNTEGLPGGDRSLWGGGGKCFVCLGNQAILICSKGVSGFPELPADTLLWMPVIYAVP